MEIEGLKKNAVFPCIIHWEFNHFVVLDDFRGDKAVINDPARGKVTVSMEQFDRSFTGLCLTFAPSESFTPSGKRKSTMSYAFSRLRGAGPAAAFVILTSVIASLFGIINPTMSRLFYDRLLTRRAPEWLIPFIIAGVCIALIVLLINSSYGRAFKAIRDDEVAAEAMGINLAHHKRLAFCISSFFAGVGGAMLAMYQTTVQAKSFTSAMTYEILLIVVIGGIGSVTGSVFSSFLFVACSEWWLRFLDEKQIIGDFEVPLLRTGFRMVVFSVIIMIVVLFFRRGIMGDKELPDLLSRREKKRRGALK